MLSNVKKGRQERNQKQNNKIITILQVRDSERSKFGNVGGSPGSEVSEGQGLFDERSFGVKVLVSYMWIWTIRNRRQNE